MTLHIIHLPRRQDRLQSLSSELATQQVKDFRIWEGVEDPISPYAGIARAHKQIVSFALQQKYPRILIAEDDVKFTAPGALIYFLKNEPPVYDLYLGGISYGHIIDRNLRNLGHYIVCDPFVPSNTADFATTKIGTWISIRILQEEVCLRDNQSIFLTFIRPGLCPPQTIFHKTIPAMAATTPPKPSGWYYFWKATKWYFGNALFGLVPLLTMLGATALTHKHESADEVNVLILGGLVLFAAIAIAGAAFVDVIIENYRPVSSGAILALYVTPVVVIVLLVVVYAFIIFGDLSKDYFIHHAWIYCFVIGFSLVYSIFAKYLLYKED
jgi:hypothetical protein